MTWFLTTRFGRALSAAGTLILALLTIFAAGRRRGGESARRRAREADQGRANEIEEKVDETLRRLDGDHRDVDERLRELGGFRRD